MGETPQKKWGNLLLFARPVISYTFKKSKTDLKQIYGRGEYYA